MAHEVENAMDAASGWPGETPSPDASDVIAPYRAPAPSGGGASCIPAPSDGDTLRIPVPSDGDTLRIPAPVRAGEPYLWLNPAKRPFAPHPLMPASRIDEAAARLERFAPFLAERFPETAAARGLIESPIDEVDGLCAELRVPGRLLLKRDDELPIAGSVKARGGIYAVLAHAEELAIADGRIARGDDYRWFGTHEARRFFSARTLQVGSTGNLGLSIGITGAALGFHTVVHMSADAKRWKKDLLRSKGVDVREYAGDYGAAVARGRAESAADALSHFIDDERSETLFEGYAVAARRLRDQLAARKVTVDESHPLVVWLPCGVGGAPGGISYGLKLIYGASVRCFFVEPTQSCCMLVGLASGRGADVDVRDVGLSGETESDGLAVTRPSSLVCELMGPFVDGVLTCADGEMFALQKRLWRCEGIFVEPSAATSLAGPAWTAEHGIPPALEDGAAYSRDTPIASPMLSERRSASPITQIAWSTGGSLVPADARASYLG